MATDENSKARAGRGVLDVIATVVSTVFRLAALLIVLGILFVVLEANPDNGIASFVNDIADFLVGPFDDLFEPKDEKLATAINWGIAVIVYVVVGTFIARLLRR